MATLNEFRDKLYDSGLATTVEQMKAEEERYKAEGGKFDDELETENEALPPKDSFLKSAFNSAIEPIKQGIDYSNKVLTTPRSEFEQENSEISVPLRMAQAGIGGLGKTVGGYIDKGMGASQKVADMVGLTNLDPYINKIYSGAKESLDRQNKYDIKSPIDKTKELYGKLPEDLKGGIKEAGEFGLNAMNLVGMENIAKAGMKPLFRKTLQDEIPNMAKNEAEYLAGKKLLEKNANKPETTFENLTSKIAGIENTKNFVETIDNPQLLKDYKSAVNDESVPRAIIDKIDKNAIGKTAEQSGTKILNALDKAKLANRRKFSERISDVAPNYEDIGIEPKFSFPKEEKSGNYTLWNYVQDAKASSGDNAKILADESVYSATDKAPKGFITKEAMNRLLQKGKTIKTVDMDDIAEQISRDYPHLGDSYDIMQKMGSVDDMKNTVLDYVDDSADELNLMKAHMVERDNNELVEALLNKAKTFKNPKTGITGIPFADAKSGKTYKYIDADKLDNIMKEVSYKLEDIHNVGGVLESKKIIDDIIGTKYPEMTKQGAVKQVEELDALGSVLNNEIDNFAVKKIANTYDRQKTADILGAYKFASDRFGKNIEAIKKIGKEVGYKNLEKAEITAQMPNLSYETIDNLVVNSKKDAISRYVLKTIKSGYKDYIASIGLDKDRLIPNVEKLDKYFSNASNREYAKKLLGKEGDAIISDIDEYANKVKKAKSIGINKDNPLLSKTNLKKTGFGSAFGTVIGASAHALFPSAGASAFLVGIPATIAGIYAQSPHFAYKIIKAQRMAKGALKQIPKITAETGKVLSNFKYPIAIQGTNAQNNENN